MKERKVILVATGVAVLLCVLGGLYKPGAMLAAYLAAWWFWIGLLMGGLANIWLHNLTGGAWGEAIRSPLLHMSRTSWIAALLFLPVLLGMNELYPWAAHAGQGMARWTNDYSAPAFKNAWLMPTFFIARSIVYLLIWVALAYLSQRPGLRRSRAFSAFALIAYGLSMSLAAVDWIMSLLPAWYSSVFGWLAGTGQMLAGMALAIVLVTRPAAPASAAILRDLGNLMLMYVLTWAYLAFVQFLIIWAENLPHEIAWYLPRMKNGWLVVAWILVLFHFAAPLLILLSRNAKRSARLLGSLAIGMLTVHLIDAWWLVLPSVRTVGLDWLWAAPLATIALGGIVLLLTPYRELVAVAERGQAHA
ncbi:hypothetical protein [Noviherbaspirillum massiliense]|uniref:hypothetical protein n=1 Tax=Noviherbaspirillum massiliense TaxID=1465823 RepID=UPI00031C31FD|nr:hypothetical protein [Noviherbaspirillum massiliense]